MTITVKASHQRVETYQALDVRNGEGDKFWFRGDRFFMVGLEWYFTTREEFDVGPYKTREEAIHGLELFIECVQKRQTTIAHARTVAMEGDWAVVGFH